MKITLPSLSVCVLLASLLQGRLAANPVVTFGESDFYDLAASPAPTGPAEPAKHAFFEAYTSDQAGHDLYETSLDLINPPDWGKTISADTRGVIEFHPSFKGGLACRLVLNHLQPDHDYILTLNGNPSLAGNDLFLSAVPGNAKERYYDFLIVKSDSIGHYDCDIGIFLKVGAYKARCYVKDASDFKIVLYHDYFPFVVK